MSDGNGLYGGQGDSSTSERKVRKLRRDTRWGSSVGRGRPDRYVSTRTQSPDSLSECPVGVVCVRRPVGSSTCGHGVRTLCRDTRWVRLYRGLVWSSNVGLVPGLFIGVPGGGRLCRGPVGSSTHERRTRTLYWDFRRGPSVQGPVDSSVYVHEGRSHYRGRRFGSGFNRLGDTRVSLEVGLFVGSLGWGPFRCGDDGF